MSKNTWTAVLKKKQKSTNKTQNTNKKRKRTYGFSRIVCNVKEVQIQPGLFIFPDTYRFYMQLKLTDFSNKPFWLTVQPRMCWTVDLPDTPSVVQISENHMQINMDCKNSEAVSPTLLYQEHHLLLVHNVGSHYTGG